MTQGISIHIGLNEIDGTHYGTSGALRGCENDARAMQAIATNFQYESTILLTSDATSTKVLEKLRGAAKRLVSGDILFISYAGHGSQVRDTDSEELDKMDETWCLYDRMLLDDELYGVWGSLQPGVRVLMVSDSCHSATMSRYLTALEQYKAVRDLDGSDVEPRGLPREIAEDAVAKARDLYGGIKHSTFRDGPISLSSTVMLLAACQDNQTAGDGLKNGLFTEALLKTWNGGQFKGHYKQLLDRTSALLSTQRPNYSVIGVPNPGFESQSPFTISGARPGATNVNVPVPSGETERPSFDERLARLKAAYKNGNRALDKEHPDIGCKFDIGLDRALFNQMSEGDLYNFLRNDGCDALMRAFMQVAPVALPRGGEGTIDCHVNQEGKVHCSGSISVQF